MKIILTNATGKQHKRTLHLLRLTL